MPNYNFTRKTLLEAADRHNPPACHAWPGCSTDHIVELQVVVAALNQLPDGTYTQSNWQTRLVDFFNDKSINLQDLDSDKNREKGEAIRRLVASNPPQAGDRRWIELVQRKWQSIRSQLHSFVEFKAAMNRILSTA